MFHCRTKKDWYSKKKKKKKKKLKLPASLNINCFVTGDAIESLRMMNWRRETENFENQNESEKSVQEYAKFQKSLVFSFRLRQNMNLHRN